MEIAVNSYNSFIDAIKDRYKAFCFVYDDDMAIMENILVNGITIDPRTRSVTIKTLHDLDIVLSCDDITEFKIEPLEDGVFEVSISTNRKICVCIDFLQAKSQLARKLNNVLTLEHCGARIHGVGR